MFSPEIPRRDRVLGASANRRQFLAGTAALSAGTLLPGLSRLAPRTQHVILVAFAGGVRTRETFGTPANIPNLARLAKEGVVYHRARTANLGHFGASLSIFTGIAEARGIRENSRGEDPTVFEYARKELGLAPSDVWIATSGGAQQANYASSIHPDYGARYAANTLDGDGIFNQEFKRLLDAYGRPKEMEARERELLDRLRGAIGGQRSAEDVARSANDAKIENYILDELTRGTVDLRGTGAADAKALRVARNLLSIFRPKLLGVVLRDADVAHGNFNAYQEVIRRNDAMLGELIAAVQDDPELAESTAIFVLPEFGRDADLNSRRGLDHGDGSDDINYVSIAAWGPDFQRGVVSNNEVRTIDVAATIGTLMDFQGRYVRGKKLPKLFA
ncbi:MAG: hypothetical protein WD226_06265 [Planctomycetota bacterium]